MQQLAQHMRIMRRCIRICERSLDIDPQLRHIRRFLEPPHLRLRRMAHTARADDDRPRTPRRLMASRPAPAVKRRKMIGKTCRPNPEDIARIPKCLHEIGKVSLLDDV